MSKSNLEDQLRKEAIEKDCITGRQRLQGISINGGGNREVLLLQASRSKRRTHFREGHLVSHSLPSRRHRRHHRLALPPYHPTLPFSLFFFFFFRYPFPFSSQNNHQVLIFPIPFLTVSIGGGGEAACCSVGPSCFRVPELV